MESAPARTWWRTSAGMGREWRIRSVTLAPCRIPTGARQDGRVLRPWKKKGDASGVETSRRPPAQGGRMRYLTTVATKSMWSTPERV